MKYNFLLPAICLLTLLYACKPEFNLNASYKDVPVVYGTLNYQDSIHYVKIYKGFQPKENGSAFIDANNPDSIYYYNNIDAVFVEYDMNDKRTSRDSIPLNITHNFPRDSGIFYFQEERIIYYTTETIYKDRIYEIIITNKLNGNVVRGKTSVLGDFRIVSTSSVINMTSSKLAIAFTDAPNAAKNGYEIHVNFLYFEVDIATREVETFKISKNITPRLGEQFNDGYNSRYKEFVPTFYEDIAAQLKPNPNVIRYLGMPESNGTCIEVKAWAAGEALYEFLLSNQPTSSFVQVNNRYTNLSDSEGMAFGFISSRVKCPTIYFSATQASQDSLISGSKTSHLGFKPYIEYKP